MMSHIRLILFSKKNIWLTSRVGRGGSSKPELWISYKTGILFLIFSFCRTFFYVLFFFYSITVINTLAISENVNIISFSKIFIFIKNNYKTRVYVRKKSRWRNIKEFLLITKDLFSTYYTRTNCILYI